MMVLLQPLASAHFHFSGSYLVHPYCLYLLSQTPAEGLTDHQHTDGSV